MKSFDTSDAPNGDDRPTRPYERVEPPDADTVVVEMPERVDDACLAGHAASDRFRDVQAMALELQQRRAADLSPPDLDVLRAVYRLVAEHEDSATALAALRAVFAAHGAKP